MTTWMGSLAALPSARLGSMPWARDLEQRGAALAEELRSRDLEALLEALGGEVAGRMGEMLAGIEAYRRHPYRRALDDPPCLWQEGGTRLLDYGATAAAGGPPVLFVPSLINRGYILDLSERRSLVRHLARQGLRPLLVDWGAPGAAERDFDLDDYIAGRLERLLDRALELAGGRVGLVGYCMGGDLALALAQRRQGELASLALLATPWDFHAGGAAQGRFVAAAHGAVAGVVEALGELPVDILQAFFASLDPNLASRKFRAFARLAPESDRAVDFVALEDWLNDGVPLVPAVARACMIGWYAENRPARGAWRVAGRVVEPAEVELETLVALPRADRIVPPASARALAEALPRAQVLEPPSGHIGMVVGGRAPEGLWAPLAEWLTSHAE
jgi:polyhydroxyalkanoate synthase